MKIPTSIKPKLNILISYYRNLYSKTDERFMSKNFVYDDEGLEICTIFTLSRLEHNKTNSYDNIYYSLLGNLHMSYINAPKVDEIIHTVNLSLLKYAERNKSKLIIDRITKVLNALSSYLDYIIYKEQAEVYQILLDYYRDYKFNTELIDKYNKLFEIVDEPLKPILIEITVMCYTRVYLNADKSLNTMRLIKNCKCDSVISDYIKLLLYFREYKLTDEKSLGEKLIHRCEDENNKIYLCKTYNVLASLYTQQNPELAMILLQNAIDNFDKEYDINENLSIYVKNLAILASVNNLHKKSVECFQMLETLKSNILLISFPYYIYSLEKENKNLKIINIIEIIEKNKEKIKDEILINILELFKLKYGLFDNIIFSKIISELINLKFEILYIAPLLRIIEFEVYEICAMTNQFSTYKKFVKFFQ